MSNPTKLEFNLDAIGISQVVKVHKPSTHKYVAKKPRNNSPVRLFFDDVFETHEKLVKEKVAKGELDAKGNPIGTQYYDDGHIKRARGKNRGKRIIRVGNIFGDLIVRRKAGKVKAARANLKERWVCECSCGRHIIVPKYYLVRQPNPKTHCGCKVKTLKSTNPREYRIYMMMHQRCLNPNHNSYKHYSERGITIHEEWRNDLHPKDGFKKFLEHVGPSPGNGYSLDRIHNGRGYLPGNLKWSTSSEQRLNQGDRIGGYTEDQILEMGLTEDEVIEKILKGEL